MSDMAQTSLREPEQTDWVNYSSGSKYQAPPPAIGPDGKAIEYYGIVEAANEADPDKGYLNYLLDPLKIVSSGPGEGQILRFTRASVKPFEKNGEPMKGNPNKLANFLRSVGSQAKPTNNSEYRAAVKAAVGKRFRFTVDWEAYNKDTGESVKGYLSFPDDPERPGQKKSILKAGDVITERDNKGNVVGEKLIKSEVLFANARLRFFQDATPRTATTPIGGRV